MKLIDKDAVVAEIRERIKKATKKFQESETIQFSITGQIYALENLIPFLDTLKEPEVDLETFDKRVTEMWGRCAANPNDTIACLHIDSFIEIARHFFELGLAQKEE